MKYDWLVDCIASGAVQNLNTGVSQAPVDTEVFAVVGVLNRPPTLSTQEEDGGLFEWWRQSIIPACAQTFVDDLRHFLWAVSGITWTTSGEKVNEYSNFSGCLDFIHEIYKLSLV